MLNFPIVASFSWLDLDWYNNWYWDGPRRKTHKDGTLQWYGHTLEFEHSAELLTNGKWDASHPWYAVASQLIKLLPVVDCDEMPTEAHALGAQLAAALDSYSSSHDSDLWCRMDSLQCTWVITERKWQTRVSSLPAQVTIWEPGYLHDSPKTIF